MRCLAGLLSLLVAHVAEAADPPPPEAPAPIVPPTLLERLAPEYPDEARARGAEGMVLLLLTVDPQGSVSDVEVLQSAGSTLDLAASETAWQLRFEPARQAGTPVEVQIQYRFTFDLATADEQGEPVPGSLHAQVTDLAGLAVPGARVALRPLGGQKAPDPVTSGPDGRVVFAFLASGRYTVEVDHAALLPHRSQIEIRAGENLEQRFTLTHPGSAELVVTSERRTWREVERVEPKPDEGTVTGHYVLTRRDIETTPGSMEDVARAIHLLPGVVSDGDMLASFNVRGGETDDVVFLLDRVPVYNPFHLAGFNSLFNPDMIREVEVFAGAPPATVPAGLSAVVAVETWDGSPRQGDDGIDGALDISASSLRGLVMGPVTDDLNFAFAARRSYLETYFQIMKWANVVDTAFAAPEFGELSGRLAWLPDGQHRVMFTALRASDSLGLVNSDDDSLIEVDGSLQMSNTLWLTSLDHTYTPSDAVEWRTTLAGTRSLAFLERDLAGRQSQDFTTDGLYGRTDLHVSAGRHRTTAGADAAWNRVVARGNLPDQRGLPAWAFAPIGDYEQTLVEIDEEVSWQDGSAWVQDTWEGPVHLRLGGRASASGATGELLLSPRGGLSIPLPTGTIPKVAAGRYHQTPRDPQVFAPGLGNPDIAREVATQVVVGVDQGLPLPGEEGGGLLRVELWQSWLDDLIVHPDTWTPDDPDPGFANAGSGVNRGIDLMLAGRSGRVRGMLTWGLLFAERVNSLNTRYERRIAPGQDQQHTVNVNLEFQASPRWRLTSRYGFHTGRPVSTVRGTGDVDPDTRIETLEIACLNCARTGSFHNLDLRAEWRRAMDRFRLTFYAEVLNATYARNDFTPITTIEDGERQDSMFYHLPTRPFMGIRADF